MTSGSKHRRNNKPSIRYWWIPLDLQSFEPNIDFANGDGHQHSSSHTKNGKSADIKSSGSRLSTSQFVSAVVGLWDFVGQPPEQSEECLNYGEINKKENTVSFSNSQKIRPTVSVDSKKFSNDFISESCFSSSAKSDFENLKEFKRSFLLPSCNKNISSYSKWSNFLSNLDTCRYYKVTSIRAPKDLAFENESIATKSYFELKDPSNSTRTECDGADEADVAENKSSHQPSAHNIKSRDTNGEKVSCGGKNVNITENVMPPPKLQYATYLFQPVTTTEETIVESTSLNSDLHLNYDIGVLKALGQSQQSMDSNCVPVESLSKVPTLKNHIFHENCDRLIYEDLKEDYLPKQWLSVKEKLQNVFVKNKHALAGALAGTMVSLCLHPVDTVKTIIQANAAGHLSSYLILKTVVSEKGVSGLYRGISSNIASSAPISAIYTYTYESVKGALLPVLPKEYYSFAHCIAGGCSSIATSFIFTPSDRIKQQMQVGLQYQNSWNESLSLNQMSLVKELNNKENALSALIGCLEKGGISSLYAGWGAVLCRNIPHSVIKFYTYESLKRHFLTSPEPDARPNTLQTLVCGGIAGSTAALFTTPFDVVKTRLQTQVPGSPARYHGVLHALQAIAKQEGLHGLYRGLIPRLAMYVSQGAIFFASYEFLKAVFSLDAPRSSRIADNEENVDDVKAASRGKK